MILWETDYLQLCYDAITIGKPQATRVGPARALYGKSLEVFPGDGKFPLLSTRRMSWKPVFGELAAFMDGCVTNKEFIERGCTYWTANAREWKYNEGRSDPDLFLGKIYGYQWRNFGGKGVDQLAEVRRQLLKRSTSRRIILSSWNPADLDEMCLPPCHMHAQFHVDGNELTCSVYMRSVDLALGLPSDIILYYALMVVLGAETGLLPQSLHFHFGNAHIYEGHIDKMKIQLQRDPREPPRILEVTPSTPFTYQSIQLNQEEYKPYEPIRYELYA